MGGGTCIWIAGWSGTIGRAISALAHDQGYRIVWISRSSRKSSTYKVYTRDELQDPDFVLPRQYYPDICINLAGASIFRLRTKSARKILHRSRIDTTRRLIQIMRWYSPKLYLGASAIGWYGAQTGSVNEKSSGGKGFLARLCQDWEDVHAQVPCAYSILRNSIVLSPDARLWKVYNTFASYGVLAPWCGGSEWMLSWIHIQDCARAYLRCIQEYEKQNNLVDIVNIVAPQPCRWIQFIQQLYTHTRMRQLLPCTPRWSELFLPGPMHELLFVDQTISSLVLPDGVWWKYSDIDSACTGLVEKQ